MASFHIFSVEQSVAQSIPATGRVIAVNANPYNSNMCVALNDNNFSNWSSVGATTKVQQVRVPGTGRYVGAMPNTNGGSPSFYGFDTLSDLLNLAQFIPNLGGGSIGSTTYGTSSDVAVALSSVGGLLIIPTGDVTDI